MTTRTCQSAASTRMRRVVVQVMMTDEVGEAGSEYWKLGFGPWKLNVGGDESKTGRKGPSETEQDRGSSGQEERPDPSGTTKRKKIWRISSVFR